MKKLLALVLALVMSMSLVTISNAAFKDADKISNKEAVDVMAAVGVLAGYDNGEFGATDTLTRAQACKIIAYLDLGGKTADAINGSGAVFTDVAATAWYAGYVEYCAGAGYVAGVGDNKFAPDEKVTGVQFAKMLLCALGYKAEIEGYTGADYTLAIARDANKVDLFKALSIVTSAALTREQAAQMAFNALKATVVEYQGGTNVSTSDGTTVTVNAVRSEVNAAASVNYGTNDSKLQLCEKLYKNDLSLTTDFDDFGAPAKIWSYKGDEIGTYASEADKTFKGEVTKGDLYAAVGSAAAGNVGTWKFEVDGKDETSTYDSSILVKNSDDAIAVTGNGATTKVYVSYNSGSQDYDITVVVVNTYLGKISSVVAASGNAKRYVTVEQKSQNLTNLSSFETESFAKGDYVLYTAYEVVSGGSSSYTIATMTEAPAAVSTTVTSVKGTSNFVAGGTTYKYSLKNTTGAPGVGDAIDVYCDADGYVIYTVTTAASADLSSYLVLTKTAASSALSDSVVANAVTLDGTVLGGITIAKEDGDAVSNVNDVILFKVYSFTKDSNGKYNLKAAATPFTSLDAQADKTFTKGTTSFADKVVNNATKFVVYNEANKTVSVYDGISKMPSLTKTTTLAGSSNYSQSALLLKDGTASAVFVYTTTGNTSTTSTGKDLVYILDATPVVTKDANDDAVYTYTAIINGKEGTVATQNNTASTGVVATIDAVGMYYVSSYDGEYMNAVVDAGTNGGTNAPTDYKVYLNLKDTTNGAKITFAGDVLSIKSNSSTEAFTAVNLMVKDAVVYSITNKGVATAISVDDLVADASKNAYTVVTNTIDSVEYIVAVYLQK